MNPIMARDIRSPGQAPGLAKKMGECPGKSPFPGIQYARRSTIIIPKK